MPLQNRVTPAGELVADPARGLLMGNRGGRFHDPRTRSLGKRRHASKAWIICLTAFRDHPARTVWGQGYTELFFLDEVTALAAGHRPCAECRRAAARAFQDALARETGESLALPDIDRRLHGERRDGRAKQVHLVSAESLPEGAVILDGGSPYAVQQDAVRAWSFAGYGPARALPAGTVPCLTPPLSLAALRGGYAPVWHPTAT
ncbi:MAG TPA: hypothetical protein VIL65_12410 [Beijerinckiaceae bacterium]|jgi:hypothetical protein